MIGGFTAIGVIVGGLKLMEPKLTASSDNCVIVGKAKPNAKVYFGDGGKTDRSTEADSRGNYRLVIGIPRPIPGKSYILSVNDGGKRVVKWEDELKFPFGMNRIDLAQ